MAEDLPLFWRGMAVGLLLALALLGTLSSAGARRALLPLLACLAAYLLRSAPQAGQWPLPGLVPLAVGALLFPVAFWWLVRNAFADRSDLPVPAVACALVLVVAGLAAPAPGTVTGWPGGALHEVQKLVAAGFMAAALWQLWRTSAGDLVAGRRVLRMWLLGYVGLHGLVVLGVEWLLKGAAAPAWLDGLNVVVITLALSASLVFLARFDADAVRTLFGPQDRPAPAPRPQPVPEPERVAAPVPAPQQPVPSAAEPPAIADAPAIKATVAAEPVDAAAGSAWLDRLDRLMAVERAYREPELSVESLAARLGLPEYRLRELINRRLGYRNFPAFVNEYRLREVEQKLVDPACDALPILTLALEAGFGSIGPFNRAFRERHGITPSAFRNGRGALPMPAR